MAEQKMSISEAAEKQLREKYVYMKAC